MKNLKTTVFAVALCMSAALFLNSCSKESTDKFAQDAFDGNKVTVNNSENSYTDLIAGQNINTGNVSFDDIDTNNDGIDDALVVCYNTTGGWEIVETHFFIGNSTSQIPTNKSGNPIPGQFPYKSNLLPSGTTQYCITIPFSAIGFSCPQDVQKRFIVAAHAALRKVQNGVVVDTQTGWGGGTRIINKGNWGMFFDIIITCDDNTPPPVSATCETGFAYSTTQGVSTCFLNIDDLLTPSTNDFNRWGWTNGPLTTGSYTMALYTGAGQCDLSKGENVGSVTVNYVGSSATVTYAITKAGATLKEAHIYAGTSMLPFNNGVWTVAPGQYTHVNSNVNNTIYTNTINNLSGPIYVVAHAAVCGL